MADPKILLDVLKIDGILYEIHDKKARTDLEAFKNTVEETYATKSELNTEIQARQSGDTAVKAEIIGSVEDAVDVNTINGVRNALNALANNLSGVDANTLEAINELKAELQDPANSSMISFLDKVTALIAGFNTNPEAEGYTTIKQYCDSLDSALRTLIEENESTTAAALNDIETRKANKTYVDETFATKTALSDLETTVAQKASQTALEALETVLSTKAAQEDLAALETEVATKAAQADLEELQTTVGTKASQASLEAEVAARIAAEKDINDTLATRASQEDLNALSNVVDTKAAQADLEELQTTVGTKAAQADLEAEVAARQAADQAIIGDETDTSSDDTIKGLRKALNDLSQLFTGADASTIDILNQLKAELNNPSAEGGMINTFLDKVNELMPGFDTDSTSENYTGTIKQYIDGIKNTLIATLATKEALNSEIAERESLETRIAAEETARANADTVLDGKIDTETVARESADNALDQRITTLEGKDISDDVEQKTLSMVTSVSFEDGVLSIVTGTATVLDFKATPQAGE